MHAGFALRPGRALRKDALLRQARTVDDFRLPKSS